MGGFLTWIRGPVNVENRDINREPVRFRNGGDLEQPAPEVEEHRGEIAPGGANPAAAEPPRVPHEEPAKLPDSNYRYLTDPQCASSLEPFSTLSSNADVKIFAESIKTHFSRALELRREVDNNSKCLRKLVGRDENAELPACLTIWAEKAFQRRAKMDDFDIKYTYLHGEHVVSSITVLADVNDDVRHINKCVLDIITSCHNCVVGVDNAVQFIEQQHRDLSVLHRRTVAVLTAMRWAKELCAELYCFASQALSLLNNFPAAASLFGNKTGVIAVTPVKPLVP